MIKEYKIGPRNSTVGGTPGCRFDWSKFCWDGSAIHVDDCGREGHPKEEWRAPLPFVDGNPAEVQYLHVPYEFSEDARIFRLYPLDSMWTGRTYRGHLVKRQTAIKKEDGWYWILELGESK